MSIGKEKVYLLAEKLQLIAFQYLTYKAQLLRQYADSSPLYLMIDEVREHCIAFLNSLYHIVVEDEELLAEEQSVSSMDSLPVERVAQIQPFIWNIHTQHTLSNPS